MTGGSTFKITTTGSAPTPSIMLDVLALVGTSKTINSFVVALTSTIMFGSVDLVF